MLVGNLPSSPGWLWTSGHSFCLYIQSARMTSPALHLVLYYSWVLTLGFLQFTQVLYYLRIPTFKALSCLFFENNWMIMAFQVVISMLKFPKLLFCRRPLYTLNFKGALTLFNISQYFWLSALHSGRFKNTLLLKYLCPIVLFSHPSNDRVKSPAFMSPWRRLLSSS